MNRSKGIGLQFGRHNYWIGHRPVAKYILIDYIVGVVRDIFT